MQLPKQQARQLCMKLDRTREANAKAYSVAQGNVCADM